MKLKYKMEIMEIDGKPMAVPIDSGDDFRCILHMNETTADILSILQSDVTEDDIIARLLEQYDASEEIIRQSVRKIIAILQENNLII